tara:strand:+ start:14957 stop:16801 length:1845 start_codon:yes stop_codon:yes gene_type:complete
MSFDSFIGREPTFGNIEKQTITGDNSATTFTLDYAVGGAEQLLVVSNGTTLTPGTGYSLNGAGTQIVFSSAPSSSHAHHIIFLGNQLQVASNVIDANGQEFILDLDGDTSLTADTDDKIDIKIGGSDIGYFNGSGLTTTGVVTAAGFTIGSAVITEAELEILDGASVTTAELNVLDGIPAGLTATELGYVDGVTSAIQTQLDGKQATITGSATTIDTEALTASRAVISNGSQKIDVSATTSTELGYVNGVTSAIQTQLDAKAALASPTFTGTVTAAAANFSGDVGLTGSANLTIAGNLTVNGTTTTVSTTNTVLKDNLLELNNGASTNANDCGIIIERGSTGDNAIMAWDESADGFIFGTTTALADGTGDLTIAAAPLTVSQLNVGDDGQIRLGAAQDLLIYHDATNSLSVIRDAGTGGLDIRASAVAIENDGGTETMATFAVDGAVTLYHDNASKLATASDGIDVTGKVDASGAIEGVGATITGSTELTSLGIGTAASGTTGEIRATNEITAYYSSDVALKENITTIENALSKINSLRGVEFDWTQEHIESRGGEDGYFVRKHDTGIIAQDVEKVLPEIVAQRADGYKGVKYEKLMGLVIQAIKELSSKMDGK